jgi:hypothetical protein
MRTSGWLASLVSVSLVGCAMHGGGDDDVVPGDDDVVPGDDDVDPPTPPAPHAAGAYHLTSDLDVSASTILPATLYDALALVRLFSESPGEAMLDAAELAGVPAVEDLRDALPNALESRLIGWIDDKLESTPLPALAGEIADLADVSFGRVELGSTLDLEAGVHALDTIAVEVDGHRAELAVESPTDATLGLAADVDVAVNGSALTIGDHRFGLRVGTAAWNAFTAAIEARYGADLETVLADAIDCPGLAHSIANKCVLGQCVGHEDDLLEVCAAGVGYAVDKLEAQFTAVDFDAVILHAGTATADGVDADGVYTSIAGTWTAELDLGVGPRPVPATFTGAAE